MSYFSLKLNNRGTFVQKYIGESMIQFQCDYNEGAHERIMRRLLETNMEQTVGYGEDAYCEEARRLIKEAVGNPDADVHFLVGGTQTNTTVIASLLKPYQGVICADTGHINVHETGAIEHTGHKVIGLPNTDGKISAKQISEVVRQHLDDSGCEHLVQPAMVYISFSTEIGTLYSKQELTDIYSVCQQYSLPLFVDGARLGYGLASSACDVTLPELASLCDVFYIGGTKVGALFGEAVIFKKKQPGFRYHIKQQGGMLAKGRLLGIQFMELFTDGLYFKLGKHANEKANLIKEAFQRKGIPFFIESPTNQQFPILTNAQMETLSKEFLFSEWVRLDAERMVVRFCTSWATKVENVQRLIAAIEVL